MTHHETDEVFDRLMGKYNGYMKLVIRKWKVNYYLDIGMTEEQIDKIYQNRFIKISFDKKKKEYLENEYEKALEKELKKMDFEEHDKLHISQKLRGMK